MSAHALKPLPLHSSFLIGNFSDFLVQCKGKFKLARNLVALMFSPPSEISFAKEDTCLCSAAQNVMLPIRRG